MRYLKVLVCLIVFCKASFAQNKIIGKWKDASHPEKQIDVYLQNGRYYGKSLTPKTGFLVLKDLVWNANENIYEGILTNPDDNSTYQIKISLLDENNFKFRLSKFFLHKTIKFIRIF